MVGGYIIEVFEDQNGMRLWCYDPENGDECAVYVHRQPEENPTPGDRVWWQFGKVYWTPKDNRFTDHPMVKIGNSFDPRKLYA